MFHSHREHQEAFARERLDRLLSGEVHGVITGLRRMATTRRLKGEQRKTIDAVCRYFENNQHRMRYETYLRQGYPIATGVIEGACRHLVSDRMDLTGARWSLAGAEAVLRLRALRSSGDFDTYWGFHLTKEHERNHQSRYAEGVIPERTAE